MSYNKSLLLILLSIFSQANGAAVTYEFSGGRFGDCVLAALHGEWFSYKYGVPLYYKPFKYSDQLMIHQLREQLPHKIPGIKKEKTLSKQSMEINPHDACLYVIPWFSEIAFERNLRWNHYWINVEVDWDDKHFYDRIVQLISPINQEFLHLQLPDDCITVAVHVRKGQGFDGPLLSEDSSKQQNVDYADLNAPLKFPPDYFYIEQLKKISEMFNHQPIYAFIFADVFDLPALVAKFQQQLTDYPNIRFDYRREQKDYENEVIKDFFAMTTFDCLIRPQSSFSIAAAKIAQYKVEIAPTKHHWEGHKSVIEEIEVKIGRQLH